MDFISGNQHDAPLASGKHHSLPAYKNANTAGIFMDHSEVLLLPFQSSLDGIKQALRKR